MNIEDKAGLFHELHRVLNPGGKLAFMEVMAGPTREPVYFPVPWADRPELSFLQPPDNYRQKIEGADLEVLLWEDMGSWLTSLADAPDSRGLDWGIYEQQFGSVGQCQSCCPSALVRFIDVLANRAGNRAGKRMDAVSVLRYRKSRANLNL